MGYVVLWTCIHELFTRNKRRLVVFINSVICFNCDCIFGWVDYLPISFKMTQYNIQVDFGVKGYNKKGNIFVAFSEFVKNIDSGAFVKITKWK